MVKSIATMQDGKTEMSEKLKMAAGFVVGIAADMAIGAILKTHIPVMRGWRKLMVGIGAFIIGMKVGEDCENYFYKVWDDTKQVVDEANAELKKMAEEPAVEGTVQ